MSDYVLRQHRTISEPLRGFFEAEERNTRQAIAQGDLDPGHPLTLSTALDSLRQAPADVQILWMTGNRPASPADQAEWWGDAFETLLELANLIDNYGGDMSLMEWL